MPSRVTGELSRWLPQDAPGHLCSKRGFAHDVVRARKDWALLHLRDEVCQFWGPDMGSFDADCMGLVQAGASNLYIQRTHDVGLAP